MAAQRLRTHRNKHDDVVDKEACYVVGCSRTYASLAILRRHLTLSHPDRKRCPVPNCGVCVCLSSLVCVHTLRSSHSCVLSPYSCCCMPVFD